MKITKKPRRKTEADLLDQATDNLLAAMKKEMLEKEGRVDHEQLRKDGYSPRILARLEES